MHDRTATPTRRTVLAGVASAALAAAGVAGAQETTTDGEETTPEETTEEEAPRGELTTFHVRLLNDSEPDALEPSEGDPQPVVLSPGVYAVHAESEPLFTPEEPDRGEGLEALAEDGDPAELVEALAGRDGVSAGGVFDTALDGDEPGPIGPGEAYGFEVQAAPGDALSFATMFVPSNDLFFAPGPDGIPLFRDGQPTAGDVVDDVALWDAGTEENEEPGVGPNQAPRQSEPDTGPEEDESIRRIEDVDDGFEYPDVSDALSVLITPEGGTGAAGEETPAETTPAETTPE